MLLQKASSLPDALRASSQISRQAMATFSRSTEQNDENLECDADDDACCLMFPIQSLLNSNFDVRKYINIFVIKMSLF